MKYRINHLLHRGIWLCYFTRKLYLHSPSARENTTLLVKYLAIFHPYSCNNTRKMVTIEKRAGIIPYIFSSSIALLSSFLSCSFYLLDLRTISNVDILEMT